MSFRRTASLRISSLLGVFLLAVAGAAGTPAQGRQPKPPGRHAPKQVRQQITDLEEQWRAAIVAGDAAAMDKLLSDDYVGISWTGQVNTKQMQLDRLRTRAILIKRMDVADIKVKVVGPVAIVTSRAEIQGSTDNKVLDGSFRYTHVFQHLPSGLWKMTNLEATRMPSNENPPRGLGPATR